MLGGIYEHSPWVAEQLYAEGISQADNDVDQLASRMKAIVDATDDRAKLALLCAHPELAGKLAIAGDLTAESTAEQASAGLDKCSEAEFAEFKPAKYGLSGKIQPSLHYRSARASPW